ncbi:general substrate transporter [Armillaria nabsnona]|nr:general substrate transporter [Armillaria nabsnona]
MFTLYGWFVCLWITIIPFQYGYHISVLNQLQSVITCSPPHTKSLPSSLPACLPMTEFTFSVVTASFTLGGLLGSLFANILTDKYGRKFAANTSGAVMALGTAIMGLAAGVPALVIGRLFVGVSAGLGLCVAPVYIAEIAPVKIKSTLGVLTQLGIVLGIFVTQLLGLNLATPTTWRYVFGFSFAVAVAQVVLSGGIVESPRWLGARGRHDSETAAEARLWRVESVGEDREALLNETPDDAEERRAKAQTPPIAVPNVLLRTPADLRLPLLVVSSAMLAQQVSGINAVLYYSNNILSGTLPDLGPYISLGITVVNVLMTFPPIILIERWGRKRLLILSTLGALLSLVTVGVSLNYAWKTPASIAIITFVMSFAIGLGPIPFIIIPEVSPFYAVSALSSIALSLNWIANFLVGLAFLPLRRFLSGGEESKQGRVFWVFAVVLAATMTVVAKGYKGR